MTLLAICWFVYLDDNPSSYTDEQKTQREAVERFFLTNAFSFFVGWCHGRVKAAALARP
tara:strand:- start:482 stop:658 length:177 start_codon:yes stop_codon:yes gene_type:complete